MKKLMTMLAAAAMAFGLYADGAVIAGTDFEDIPTSLTLGVNTWTGSAFVADWWANVTADMVVPGTTGQQEKDNVPDVFSTSSTDDEKVLNIKTTLYAGQEVTHYTSTDKLGIGIPTDGLYFDGLVNMTMFDEEPALDYTGAKIAVYAQEIEEEEVVTGTNFVIVAKAVGSNEAARFVCSFGAKEFTDGWHRLTIKAIGNITTDNQNPVPGFVVFLDGIAAECEGAKIDATGLTLAAQDWNENGNLFVSLVGSDATVKSIAFDGQGSVDELVFTTEAPGFAKDLNIATVAFDATKATNVVYSTDGGQNWIGTDDANPFKISAARGAALPASILVKWEGVGSYMDETTGITVTLTADQQTTIPGTAYKAAVAQIGDNKYETLAAAALAAQNATIVLLDNVTEDVTFTVAGATLDLNGKTVTGAGEEAAAIVIDDDGSLTIKDEAENGGVVAAATKKAVRVKEGSCEILSGNFNGALQNDDDLVVTAGKFSNDPSAYVDQTLYDVVSISEDPYFFQVIDHVAKPGTVIFLAGDGKEFSTEIPNQTAGEDGKVIQPEAQDDSTGDYRVIGWIDEDGDSFDFANDTIPVDTTVELTAVWSKYFAKIGTVRYATLEDAVKAAVDGDTIELTDNSVGAGFAGPLGKFPTGLTIDLKNYTFTFSGGPTGSSGGVDGFNIQTGNVITVKNGTLAVAAQTTGTLRDIVRIYGYADNTTVTFTDVTFDGDNLLALCEDKATDVIRIEGGNVNFTGTTAISGTAAYAVKVGNHASPTQYECGKVVFNTTGDIKGKVILMGGEFQEVAVGSGSAIEYRFANNAHSTYVDGMATDENGAQLFAARIGVLPAVTGTADDETNDVGVLYKDLAAAKAAAGKTDTLTLIKPITLTENTTFDCVVAVASNDVVDARIALATFSFTENGGALTSNDFTTEVDKKDNGNDTFTYTVKSAEQPAKPDDPIVVPAGTAEAKAAELNQKGNDAKDLPDAVKALQPALSVEQVKAYKDLFTFVATSDTQVELQLTDPDNVVSGVVATATAEIEVAKIAAGTADEITFTGIPGLYYQLNAAATLKDIEPVEEVLCGADGAVKFDTGVAPGDSDTARFFKISASASKKISDPE